MNLGRKSKRIINLFLTISAIVVLASCDGRKAEQSPHSGLKDETLATCKVAALQQDQKETETGFAYKSDIVNFFDACMASKGYKRDTVTCTIPTTDDGMFSDPAFSYFANRLSLGDEEIENCYAASE